MQEWKFLAHTADICVLVRADHYEGVFHAALQSMNEILLPGFCESTLNDETINFKINLEAIDSTVLLIDFLSEVLTITQIHKCIVCQLEFEKLDARSLACKLFAKAVHSFKDDIKAVTYHRADLKKTEDGRWTTEIIYDI